MQQSNQEQESLTDQLPNYIKVHPLQHKDSIDSPDQKEQIEDINLSQMQTAYEQSLKDLDKFLINFNNQSTSNKKESSEQRLELGEDIYSGIILLRKISRLLLQFLLIGIFLGIFIWGYFVTTKNTSWTASGDTPNINMFVRNCFVNVSQSEVSILKFSYKAKGSLMNQVNQNGNFLIAGNQDSTDANLTFTNPDSDLRSCIIDLELPKMTTNLSILCYEKSTCVIAFGQDQLSVKDTFNATAEPKAQMQINIRNIVAKKFIYYSLSQGNLYLNHFKIVQADIRMLSGDIVLQSTKSFYLNFSSQSDSYCFSGYYIGADEKNTQNKSEALLVNQDENSTDSSNSTNCEDCFYQWNICEYQFKKNKTSRRILEDTVDNGNADEADQNGGNGQDETDQNGEDGEEITVPDGWFDEGQDENQNEIPNNGDDEQYDENMINFEIDEIEPLTDEYKCTNSKSQIITVIGNSSTIYANSIFKIGVPLKNNYYGYYIENSPIFDNDTFDFNEQSKDSIYTFLEQSGSADVAVRLDVDGHYLLQHSYSSYWTYFSNPNYADFSPWWLSAFSGTLLNPEFTHLQVGTSPGLCPWYPSLNSRQALQIQQLIQSTFNTSYGEVIFIEPDSYVEQNETLNAQYYYKGFDRLFEKKRNQYEKWAILKSQANNIIYETMQFNSYFLFSIILSVSSSVIFGAVCTFLLIVGLFQLENFVIEQSSQFQNYSESKSMSRGVLSAITQKMIEKLDQLASKRSPPILLGILSYGFYVFSQQKFKNAARMFCGAIFRKSNPAETRKFYDGTLEEKYLTASESEIKEQYQQFCFLFKLTVEPLSEQEQLLDEYGFGFVEKMNTLVIAKIKFNPNAKPYHELEPMDITSNDSLEIFMATQCLLTGIIADTLESEVLQDAYVNFCGENLTAQIIDFKDLTKKYGLVISDQKVFDFKKKRNENSLSQTWLGSLFAKYAKYIPLMDEMQSDPPVYILRKNNEINNIIQNPVLVLCKKQLSLLHYNKVMMLYQSIKFNFKKLFNKLYSYREQEDGNLLLDFFDAIYMNGWLWTDVTVVLGNFLITAVTIIPVLFFIIIINTSYSPYSIYDPKKLLFMSDVLNRPWTIIDYFEIYDKWVIVLAALIAYYAVSQFLFQSIKYLFSHFPDEVAYMFEYKFFQHKILKFYNWFQWAQFLILAFSVFVYFGLIVVWLILGSIINPNYFLVYSSSAVAFTGFINAQYSQLMEVYKKATTEINDIIKELYLRTFSTIAAAIIKEIQKLNDSSITIINSTPMDTAKNMAQRLGFDEELNELCIQTQNMIENSGNSDLNLDMLNFKEIKDKFIEIANQRFVKTMKDQYNVPETFSELFIKIYLQNLDAIIDPFTYQIQILSKNKIPALLIKWFSNSSTRFYEIMQFQRNDARTKTLNNALKGTAIKLLESIVDTSVFESKQDTKGILQRVLKIFVKSMYHILEDQNAKNILKQYKLLFEQVKCLPGASPTLTKGLEIFFDFLQALYDNSNIELAKNKLINQLVQLLGINEEIYTAYQFLFPQEEIYVNWEEQNLSKSSDQINFIIQFTEKMIAENEQSSLKENQLIRQKLEFLISFAIYYLNKEKLPINDFIQLLINNKILDSIQSDKCQQNVEFQNFINLAILLCQIIVQRVDEVSVKGIEFNCLAEIVTISSKYYWSSALINENYVKESLEKKNSLKRSVVLQGFELTKEIAQALQLSELATTGLILVLQSELYPSKYHYGIYEELVKICWLSKDSQVEHVKFSLELLSMNEYEEIFYYLLGKKQTELLEIFVKIVFSTHEMFIIFNGYQIIEKILDKNFGFTSYVTLQTQKLCLAKAYLHDFGFTDAKIADQIWNFELQGELQISSSVKYQNFSEIINYYKSGKVSFFTFLKKQQIQEESLKCYKQIQSLKAEFVEMFELVLQIKHQPLYGILQQQQDIILKSEASSSVYIGFKQEPYKQLMNLLLFSNYNQVMHSISFFKGYSKQSNLNMQQIFKDLKHFIAIEKLVSQLIIPDTVPFYFQKLKKFFINQLLSTNIDSSSSIFIDIVTDLKYQIEPKEFKVVEKILFGEKTKSLILQPMIEYKFSDQTLQSLKKIKNNLQYSENLVKIALDSNKTERINLIKEIILDLYSAENLSSEEFEPQVDKISKLLAYLMNKDLQKALLLFEDYSDQILNKNQKEFCKKQIQFFTGLLSIEQPKRENIVEQQLIEGTQRLKYFLTSSIGGFQAITEHFFRTVLQNEKPNQNFINGFFSIMTQKPDYHILQNTFDIYEDDLNFATFIVKCIFQESKAQLLQDFSAQEIIRKRFQVKELKPMIDLASLLEQKHSDQSKLIAKLNLYDSPLALKLFNSFFALKQQLLYEEDLKSYQDTFDKLYIIRQQLFNKQNQVQNAAKKGQKDQLQSNQIGLPQFLEMIHWFSHPRPLNYIFMMNKIQINQDNYEDELTLFCSAVGAIGSYDRFNQFQLKSSEEIRSTTEQIQSKAKISISQALLYIAQNNGQDLQESFYILMISSGIHPLLINAIFSVKKNESNQDNKQEYENKYLHLLLQTEKVQQAATFQKFINNFFIFSDFNNQKVIEILETESMLNFENLSKAQENRLQIRIQQLLNLSNSSYSILQSILKKYLFGDMGQKFPFSSVCLIYLLKLMRDVKMNEYDKTVRYIKGTNCLSLIFTIYERHLFFNKRQISHQFSKQAYVKLFSMGLFQSSELKTQKYMINFTTLESLHYPGLAHSNNTTHNDASYLRLPNLELLQSDLDNYEENLKISFKTEEFKQYNEFWTSLFANQYQKEGLIFLDGKILSTSNNSQFDQYSTALNQLKDNKNQLSAVYQLILQFDQVNLSQFNFVKTKYWDKSLELLKKQIFHAGEQQSFLEDQQAQIAAKSFLCLLQYYSNQYSSEKSKDEDEKIIRQPKDREGRYKEQLLKQLLIQNIPKIIPKYKFQKLKELKPISQIIQQILQLYLCESEIVEYKELSDILFDFQNMDLSYISFQWGKNIKNMNTILMILIRVELENQRNIGKFSHFARMIPQKFLYYSIGDNHVALKSKEILEENSSNLNLGLESILNNCQEFSKNIKESLKLLIRCCLGDIEAWYLYFEKLRGQKKFDFDNLSEKILRSVITELLIQLKNKGCRSQLVQKEIITTQSFYQLLTDQFGFDLVKQVEILTEKALHKLQQEQSQADISNFGIEITSFVQFIINPQEITKETFEQVVQVVKNFMSTSKKEKKNTQLNQSDLNKLLLIFQKLLQMLFNIENQNLLQLEFRNQEKQMMWQLAESSIEVQKSKSLTQFLQSLNSIFTQFSVSDFKEYYRLFISYLCVTQIFDEKNQEDNQETIKILIYSLRWFYNKVDQNQTNQQYENLYSRESQHQNLNNSNSQDNDEEEEVFRNFFEKQSQQLFQPKRQNIIQTLLKLKQTIQTTNEQEIKNFLEQIEAKIFNLADLPSIVGVILKTLASNSLNQNQDPEKIKLQMKEFVSKLLLPQLNADQKGINVQEQLSKVLIDLRYIQKIEDQNIKMIKEIIVQIFSEEKQQVEPIIAILFNYLQDQQKFSLQDLPLKIADLCLGQNLNDPSIPLQELSNAIQETYKKIQNQQKFDNINDKFLNDLLKSVSTIILQKKQNQDQRFEIGDVLKCIEAIIAIKNRKFEDINQDFFSSLGLQNGKQIIQMLKDFQMSLEAPQKLIKDKMATFVNPKISKTMQYMTSVVTKLNDNKELSYEDMFKVIDKLGKRIVQASEILIFLQRINIEITEHKFTEILVNVKKTKVNLQSCSIDFYEFKELMEQLSEQTILLSLQYLGISKPFLFWTFAVLIIYFAIVIAFILIGVKAFAIPGTFASIINSLLPILGGTGLNQKSVEDCQKILNNINLKTNVMKAMKVLQSKRT